MSLAAAAALRDPRVDSGTRAQDEALAFVDVSVVPMTRDGVLEHQTVVVRGDRIVALGPNGQVAIPPGVRRVDGRGKYLAPGLGDAHAHLSLAGGGTALAQRALDLFPLFGVTMIRSMYTEPHHRALLAQAEGRIWPRTVVASPALTGQSAPTPQAARDSVLAFKLAGYPTVKVLPGLTSATFDTLVAEARKAGLPLAGHVPASVSLDRALGAGFVSLEHLDGLMEALVPAPSAPSGFFGFGVMDRVDTTMIAALARRVAASAVVIVPTETAMERFVSMDSGATLARRPEMRFVDGSLIESWIKQKDGFARGMGVTPERAARYRNLRRRLIAELHRAGVTIAHGSDAFNLFDVPGASLVPELVAYTESGLSNQEALRTATVAVARLLALPGVTGTIAVGSVADLVLLDANPLEDIRHLSYPAGVMLRGRWLDRAELDRLMARLVTRS